MKFRVGDRVIVNGEQSSKKFNNELGVIKKVSDYDVLVEFDRHINGHDGYAGFKKGYCWFVDHDKVKLANDEKIIIYRNGDKVRIREWDDMGNEFDISPSGLSIIMPDAYFTKTMRHLCGRVATITHVEPDFCGTSVKLNFEDKSGDISWKFTTNMIEHITDEEFEAGKPKKLYNGKVVCVDHGCNTRTFTIGKIYKFVDGMVIDDLGDTRPALHPGVESLEEFNNYTATKFIEVIE